MPNKKKKAPKKKPEFTDSDSESSIANEGNPEDIEGQEDVNFYPENEKKAKSGPASNSIRIKDPHLIKFGNYRFSIKMKVDNNKKFLSIEAKEVRKKDIFSAMYSFKVLDEMRWLEDDPEAIKDFISICLFKPDKECSHKLGFTTDEKCGMEKAKKTYDGKNTFMLIEISIKISKMKQSKNWLLQLKYIEQDEIKKLNAIIFDQQLKLDELENELKNRPTNPSGVIVMWSGSTQKIPEGWALCNGKNGTPDLRNRFIIGASSEIPALSKGGSKEHSHEVKVDGHILTKDQMPKHSHSLSNKYLGTHYTVASGGYCNVPSISGSPSTDVEGGNQPHNHKASSSSINHLPPYYAMAYIMKIK